MPPLFLAPSCVAMMATFGGRAAKSWCAQMGPGGRPSMGPVSPAVTPGKAGSRSCCVWFDSAVGAGSRASTLCRFSTSKRGIGVENGGTPKSGLRGAPVGPDSGPPCLA